MGYDGMVMMDGTAVGKGRPPGRLGYVVVGRQAFSGGNTRLSVGGGSCFWFWPGLMRKGQCQRQPAWRGRRPFFLSVFVFLFWI